MKLSEELSAPADTLPARQRGSSIASTPNTTPVKNKEEGLTKSQYTSVVGASKDHERQLGGEVYRLKQKTSSVRLRMDDSEST